MLAWHGEHGEVEAALGVCSRKAQQQPSLWCSMLRLLASPSSPNPPNPHHLSTCLNNIGEETHHLLGTILGKGREIDIEMDSR